MTLTIKLTNNTEATIRKNKLIGNLSRISKGDEIIFESKTTDNTQEDVAEQLSEFDLDLGNIEIVNIELTNNSTLQIRGMDVGDIDLKISSNGTIRFDNCQIGDMRIVATNNSDTFINGSRIDNLVGTLFNNSDLDGFDNFIAKRTITCSNNSSCML